MLVRCRGIPGLRGEHTPLRPGSPCRKASTTGLRGSADRPRHSYYANFGAHAATTGRKGLPDWRPALPAQPGQRRGAESCSTIRRRGASAIRRFATTGQNPVFLPARRLEHYHLYEDQRRRLRPAAVDRRTTRRHRAGLPSHDDIIFCSSRRNRWVACWKVPVANLHRCSGRRRESADDQQQRRPRTPRPCPRQALLYTRWEYNDPSQLAYHHLWTINLDGTGQAGLLRQHASDRHGLHAAERNGNTVNFANVPGDDARHETDSGTRTVVSVFSPGHGRPSTKDS